MDLAAPPVPPALPHGWALTTLGDAVKHSISQAGAQNDNFVYIDISSVDNKLKRIIEPKQIPTPQAPSRARQCLEPGDVLVSMTRPNLNAVAMVPTSMSGAIGSTGFHVLRAVAAVPQLLFYHVQSHAFVDALTKLVQGALYPAVRPKDIDGFCIALPPLPEQERIVAEIERQFSLLDAGVANLKRVQANLKRYRASVLQAACEGRLVPNEAELAQADGRPYEPAQALLMRILAERRARWEAEQLAKMEAQGKLPISGAWKAKYQEPAAPDTSGLPELPEGWVWSNSDIVSEGRAHSLKAGPFGSALKKEYYVPSGYKIYGQEQVIRGNALYGDYYINDAHYQRLKSCAVKPGDLLISLVGTIGKVLILPEGIEPGIINPRLLKVSLNTSAICAEYFKTYLESENVRRIFSLAAHGGTMDILNLTILKGLPVPLPPRAEQERIVTEVERHLSIIDNMEQVVTANLKRAERLRQSILKEAFAGRLVPQDPTDEPASVLLKRIQAEREANRKPAQPLRRKEKPHAANGHHDTPGEAVSPRHAHGKRGTQTEAPLQPDLFSTNGR